MEASVTLSPSQTIVMENVPWVYYWHSREVIDYHRWITYDRGRMEVGLAESYGHATDAALLHDMLLAAAMARDIPVTATGRLTLAREELDCGCEPDGSFFITHEAPPPDVRDIDLNVHQPPDLVIEVDLTSHSVDKEPIYAAMGVAELWRWEHNVLTVRRLVEDAYQTVEASGVLPKLDLGVLGEHLRLRRREPQFEVLRRWRAVLSQPAA
jgi:Uma2 family endonuclease